MNTALRLGASFLGLAAFALATTAQVTVIPPGADLVAAVDAAQSGDILEIQSNDTYVGTLNWTGRALTLRAGAGFAPTIEGFPGQSAILVRASSAGTVANLEGLTLAGGTATLGTLEIALNMGGTGDNRSATLLAEDCTFVDRVGIGGTGEVALDVTITDSTFEAGLYFGGTGDSSVTAVVEDSTVIDRLRCGLTGSATTDLTCRRLRVLGATDLLANSESDLTALFESILGIGPADVTGVGVSCSQLLNASLAARFVGMTITGFDVGISTNTGTAVFENVLLNDNVVDIASTSGLPTISNSLIPDGTLAGANGNVQATALLDANFAPIPTSPGVDAGNDAAVGLGPLDLDRAPRVQDADGDGVLRVNMGAIETPSCPPTTGASETVRVGVPANPNVLLGGQTSAPILGRTWDPRVDHTSFFPGATVDYLAIGRTPVNVPTAALGTLLIDPGRILVDQLVPAGTAFQIPIPGDCSFVGFTFNAQAASVGPAVGPTGPIALTNALDLVLGWF